MRKLVFCLAVLAFAFMAPVALQAQTKGSLAGTVTDPAGAVVTGASVELKNNATGATLTTTTGNNGVFNFVNIDPGVYTVTVTNTGFKKAVAGNIEVNVSSPAQVSIALEVGNVGEVVNVTGVQDVINSTSPSLTNVIDTRQVRDLPLPTRNPLDLAALQAGIAVVGNDTRGSSVAGLRQTATNVTQDGINAMDNFVKTSSFFAINAPSLNSVSEFSITTGTVGSEAGRGVGQVNLVTKGGTNDFHGGIFYLHRNDALNASPFFNNFAGLRADGTQVSPRPLLRQHFFGFDIGGPVYFLNFGDGGPRIFNGKDRAFFFFSYEGFRENFSVTRNRTVLTSTAKQGLFRLANGTTVNLLTLSSNGFGINPITAAILNAVPAPNNTSCAANDGFNISCFQYNVTGSDPNDKYVARYDHQLVKDSSYGAHKFEFVLNRAHFFLGPDTFNGLEAPFPGGQDAFQESKRWLVTGALVSNFGSSITNVFRYGRQWAPVGFLRNANPTSPFIAFSGITTPDNTFMSQGRNTKVNQYVDNFSWASGKHLFRFGADFQKIFADTFNDAGINQQINLGTNSANGVGFTQGGLGGTSAEFTRASSVYVNVVGLLGTSTRTFNVTSPTSGFVPGATRSRLFQERDVALYGQDQWRMRSNLTLNYGVRWEFLGVPTIPNGLAIQPKASDIFGISGYGNLFNPNAPAGAAPGIATQNFVSGDTGIPLYNNDWNNFAPFIGLAWSPNFKDGFLHTIFGSPGRSSVRLGYSISYLHDGFTTISNALGVGTTNPGLIQTAANNTPTGVLTAGGVPLTTPTFTIPITDRQNFLTNSGNGIWAIDPNLKIPYVQQWNIGYEREIFPNTALEVRYVGNHAVKVWRANDFNEVNIFENGFLQEFLNAQRNLALQGTTFAPGCSGCVALPILSKFFTGLPASSGFSSSTFISNLNQNNVGTFASTLAFSPTYRANRENVANGIPANFFVANPNAAFARLLTNDSMSNYHALEVEVRRRFASGLQFQADYTFSKALTDAADAQGNNQSDLVSFRTLRNKFLDYRRANFDQTHRFVANAIYEMPFGKGRMWFSNANGVVNTLIGNWSLGGIVTWSTRPPWFINSNRTTFNSFNSGNNPINLVGMSFDEFKKHIGLFNTPSGLFFIDPALLCIRTATNGPTGCTADGGRYQSSAPIAGLFAVPAPGTFGNFPMNSIDGPTYFNVDMSIIKRIPVGERVKLELKTTFINILNHPNFIYNGGTFDASTFGFINGQSGSERIIHFTGSVRF
jgi:hypothetical protein